MSSFSRIMTYKVKRIVLCPIFFTILLVNKCVELSIISDLRVPTSALSLIRSYAGPWRWWQSRTRGRRQVAVRKSNHLVTSSVYREYQYIIDIRYSETTNYCPTDLEIITSSKALLLTQFCQVLSNVCIYQTF